MGMRLIDEDALWEKMGKFYEKRAEEANMTDDIVVCVTWHDAVVLIKDAPIIEERKHGKWEYISFMTVKCSNCQEIFHELAWDNFCPNCGADMRKGEEE